MASTDAIPKPPPRPLDTPPNSPVLPAHKQMLTLEHVQQYLLKAVLAIQTRLAPATQSVKNEEASGDEQGAKDNTSKVEARGSKLESKTVREIWDEAAYEYKVVEIQKPSDELNELDQYVFIVRVRIDKATDDAIAYVDIKSEGLRDILRTVLRDVNGICLREDKPTIERNLLYQYLPELEAYRNNADNDPERNLSHVKPLDILIDHIHTEYQTTTESLTPLLENNEITYALLWALFKPNDIIYTTCFGTGNQRCVIFDHGEEKTTVDGSKYHCLECRYLDFNGTTFGEALTHISIPKFRGTKRINTLKAFPLQYHQDTRTVKAELIECGRKFISLMGAHHRHCRGEAFIMEKDGPVQFSLNYRIIVDAAFFRTNNPNYSRPRIEERADTRSDESTILYSEPSSETKIDQVKSTDLEPTEMQERDLLICCPTVPGFSLGLKTWAEFAVAGIGDIEWSASPFDCLTISDDQKNIIMALAETYTRRVASRRFDDFVAGKGQGLNVLLHGPPGVGKTLTAEGVSERLQRPLYSISTGELDLTSGQLEAQLTHIFRLARHWDAILLLDEADVFLERRSAQDVHRNGLVAVFLRKLEYFKGLLLLTTNRVSEFDEAILSRIHLTLKYNDLDSNARRRLWGNFLQRACTDSGAACVSDGQVDCLAAIKFNGRQIKNTVAIAYALATKGKAPVSFSQLSQALSANGHILSEVNGPPVDNNDLYE